MAVIWLDLSSTATWARVRVFAPAQAPTRSRQVPFNRRLPRRALPSIWRYSMPSRSRTALIQLVKRSRNHHRQTGQSM
jgi:hypothetical protein